MELTKDYRGIPFKPIIKELFGDLKGINKRRKQMRFKKGKKYVVTYTEELVYFGGDKNGKIKLFESPEDKDNFVVVPTKNIYKVKEIK